MVKNVIFDLDGTILDTSRGIVESVRKTIDVMGFQELSEEELLSFIGPPLQRSFLNNCRCTEDEAQKATNVFREYYRSGAMFLAERYDGMMELCGILNQHGIKMGVATNKLQRFAEDLIKKFELDDYMMSVCGADENGSLSKSDLIRLCMKKLGASEDETVLVGDTDNDAVGAMKAGVLFLAVTYGFGFKEAGELKDMQCVGVAANPLQIADIILNTKKKNPHP